MLKASLRFPLRTGLLATWLLATGALTTGLLTGLLVLFPVSDSFAKSPDGAEGQGATKSSADGLGLGSYLAGRIARGQNDTAEASEFYRQALARDPSNEALLEQAMLMHSTEGRIEEAIRLAKQLVEKNNTHRMAKLVLALADAKAGKFPQASENFAGSAVGVMGELTSALSRAWMMAAQGEHKAAIDLLDGLKQAEWAQFYIRYHKALIQDVAGKKQDARAGFERLFRSEAKSLRVALAYAQHTSAAGDQKLARSIMDEHVKKNGGAPHPMARAVVERLKGGDKIELLVETPIDGLAEVYYGLGEALTTEASMASVGAVYLQMSLHLKPQSPFALAALASYYETIRKYEQAIQAYDRIPPGSALQSAIDIRKALNLNQLERVDDAKKLLDTVAAQDPTDLKPIDALGTILRGHKRFDEAAELYTKAINIIGPKPEKKHWTYFYARGTCYERLKKWPLAEADLQKAMQLAPDQPQVLNYLGYSWVDQNKNLKQGLALIEKAVNLKPDDGYIVDSLGWAHYRLGNYKDAARYLERAVELRPEDPVLNDHLGDAFWRVGRETEARFQWEQALTLKPEPEDADKIKRKIEKGLEIAPVGRGVEKAKQVVRDTTKRRTENKVGRPVLQ